MSLLDRVEKMPADQMSGFDGERRRNARDELRASLYKQMPSGKIAGLLSQDAGLAAREVRGALEISLRGDGFDGLSDEEKSSISDEVFDMVLGLGPLQGLLDDPDVTEVMANGPHDVFYEKDGKLLRCDSDFEDERQMRMVIDRIVGPVGRRVDEQSPMVSARLPEGHRANIVVHPIAVNGPYITIRKFRSKVYTLSELAASKTIDDDVATFLRWAVKARKNIAVSGGTGSGKTTFLNALSCEIPTDERIITIEDSAELRFDEHPHVVSMESRPENTEGKGEVSIRDLVINSLRMRPDRIVVGECRGSEALDMLQAMNTGHDGSLTTLHANSTQEVATRLITMVRFGMDISKDVVEDQICSALDLVLHMQRQVDGSRKLVEISTCGKHPGGGVDFDLCARWDRNQERYLWQVPSWIGELAFLGVASEEEVERWSSQLQLAS